MCSGKVVIDIAGQGVGLYLTGKLTSGWSMLLLLNKLQKDWTILIFQKMLDY